MTMAILRVTEINIHYQKRNSLCSFVFSFS